MKRTTILSTLALAMAIPVAAAAFTPGENFISQWDYDGNGQVTLAEVLERRADLFASFDANEDGVLSGDELTAHDDMRTAMQATMDEERGAMQGQRGQGNRWADSQQQHQGFGRGPGAQQQHGWGRDLAMKLMGRGFGHGHGGQQRGFGQGGQDQTEMLALDANHDGSVTQEEFVSGGQQFFARFDADGNGVILPSDFGQGRLR